MEVHQRSCSISLCEQKTLKGINFFDPVDNALLHALQNPRVNIAGIRRADLLPLLDQLSPDRLSRQLRRLRDLRVIKRVAGTYRYYLTRIGRAATAALCRVTQTVIIPALASTKISAGSLKSQV